MSFQKKLLAFAAVSALSAATAVPAMALENEFHGMFKFMGYQTNALQGGDLKVLASDDAHSGFFAEQRARIMYTAKANDNLKLVTHFELDTRFGGLKVTDTKGYKGTYNGNDGGQLDADSLTLETKNVYLDFNCPITGANFKVGMQPWADAYQSLFLLADMTGVIGSKKVDNFTGSLGWFRFDDNTAAIAAADTTNTGAGEYTADLIVVDGKYALNKDITLGASYYNVQNDSGTTTPNYELLHMIGLNADMKFGDAVVKPFAAYQFGEKNDTTDISAYMFGATAKVKVGPGSVNLAGYYLSGDNNNTGDVKSFQTIAASTTYFNASNMWLLQRPGQAINTSTSLLGNDNTAKGLGSAGVFAGYEGTMDKVFYNANVGYMTTSKKNAAGDKSIGTEINAQVGYKVYDNLSASVAGAYAFLGNYFDATAPDADNPYLVNVQLSYAF